MRDLIAFAFLLPNMAGCDFEPSSTTTSSTSINGYDVNASKTRTWATAAKFDCIASASGRCRYVVFTSNCPAVNCTTKVVHAFSLSAGATRKLAGLAPGFRYCISHGALPMAPNCARTP